MTLLELLKQELKDWPEGAVYLTQDKDREVRKGEPCYDHFYSTWDVKELDSYFYPEVLASDYETAIITKEVWEND